MESKQETVICFCEEVTKKEIVEAIEEGYTTIEDLKRRLRVGMGSCQGRNCLVEISKELGRRTGRGPEDIPYPRFRLPLIPVPVACLGKLMDKEK